MLHIPSASAHPLHDSATTRRLEAQAGAGLPAHTLMQRAGAAAARLARALAPHARTVWIACGAGNNGGDGLEAAAVLHAAGCCVAVTCLADGPAHLPADAQQSWQRARQAGVPFVQEPPPLGPQDLCVDALLGLGLTPVPRRGSPDPHLLRCLDTLRTSAAPTLCLDLPSGLLADTGQYAPGLEPAGPPASARHTLSLLTLKPGLFTAHGRDAAGRVWFDSLGVDAADADACAWLASAPPARLRLHDSHKGTYGDVAIVGGEGAALRGMGMAGAALLAASAALHAGAGRVLVSLLDDPLDATALASRLPECMPRRFDTLALERATVVAGCGGGAAIVPLLGRILEDAHQLVLDADALNAIAADWALERALADRAHRPLCTTVLTPHPLEAARLLGRDTAAVQADRLGAARALAERYGCTVVLKGSGSIVAAPGRAPLVNPTGNARLATAGTGDVLAGLIGARLAGAPKGDDAAFRAAAVACWQHGAVADGWPLHQPLTAGSLARALTPW